MVAKSYIVKRTDNEIYEYLRRVPKKVAHLDPRKVIKQSLGTRDRDEALRKAWAITASTESYWRDLAQGAERTASWRRYETAVKNARLFGYSYYPAAEVATLPAAEFRERVAEAAIQIAHPGAVEAIAGGAPAFDVSLSDLWDAYFEQKRIDLQGKSKNQMKHHKGQREYAIDSVKSVIGNKSLSQITRADVLRFRQHWFDRVLAEEVTRDTANRVFSAVKGMITVVDDANATSFGAVWENLRVKGKKLKAKRVRPPYSIDFVETQFLAPGRLDRLNLQARTIVYMMIETGARPSELCNLRPEDIRLDHTIPHIAIAERDDREQKTEQSIRTIPLVGVALWAARQCPGGFPNYHDKGDSLSGAVNKFLLENNLRPTKQHVLYSLRHTFQDRLTATGAPDRLQTDIFGHEFEREKYGAGASLEQKLELLDSMKLRWAPPQPNHPSSQS